MQVNQKLNRYLQQRLDELLTKALSQHRSFTKEAEYLGLSRGVWINFRYGKTNFTTDRLDRICHRLGISMFDLFKDYHV